MLDRSHKRMSSGPDAGEVLDVFGSPLFVLSDGSSLPFVVGVEDVPPGYGVPAHVHDADDEFFYILEGELTVAGPEGKSTAGAGACVRLPRNVAHGFRNASASPARMLVVLTPGVQALEMFRHFDRAGRAAPLAPEAVMAIAGQYGVRFP